MGVTPEKEFFEMLRIVFMVLGVLSVPVTIGFVVWRIRVYDATKRGLKTTGLALLVILVVGFVLSHWVQGRIVYERQMLFGQRQERIGTIDSVKYKISMSTGASVRAGQSVIHAKGKRFVANTQAFREGDDLKLVTLPDGRLYLSVDNRHFYHFEHE